MEPVVSYPYMVTDFKNGIFTIKVAHCSVSRYSEETFGFYYDHDRAWDVLMNLEADMKRSRILHPETPAPVIRDAVLRSNY